MLTNRSRPYCAVSVDVDSFGSILKFHGSDRRQYGSYDPVYEKAMPRFLRLFDDHGIKATFFIVAEDCMDRSKAAMVKAMRDKGHEVANHSLSHRFAFSMLPREERVEDIRRSTQLISEACGARPEGFRVPGYDIDNVTIDILEEEGYRYDSSVYKFLLYPMARRFSHIMTKSVSKRHALKGLARELWGAAMPPMRPYKPKAGAFWEAGENRQIVEIPLSVMPFLNVPFNTTFLFICGTGLFDMGLWLTKLKGLGLNYNFHPTDLLNSVDDKIHAKHPGIGISLKKKLDLFHRMLDMFSKDYRSAVLGDVAGEYTK